MAATAAAPAATPGTATADKTFAAVTATGTAFQKHLFTLGKTFGPFLGWVYGTFVNTNWTEQQTHAVVGKLADAVGEKYEPPKKKEEEKKK